jgi:IclR family transcriptional regulator, KDG regulon repressor
MRLVGAVSRGLDVIEVFLTDPGPLTITQIGQRVQIPRSTLHEIVHTLHVRGYLDVDGDGFRLGLRLFELGNVYRAGLDLAAVGEEEAGRLVAATGETSQVAVLNGTDVVYVAKVDGTDMLRLVSEVGRRLPATCTGVGKAILAGLAPEAVARLYPTDADLAVMTPHSISSLEALNQELLMTRARGYALDNCESNIAVRCVAAPVTNSAGAAVAAISVSVPTVRWDEQSESILAELVLQAGRRLSRRLGATAQPMPVF